ncbi:MAG: hypothetical protein ACYCYF_01345 [Anaerolineae bacterium]
MDVILGAIIALVILGSVDRYLHPEDYVLAAPEHRAARRRVTGRRFAPRLTLKGRVSAPAHRYSIGQVSPWLPSDSCERVTVRH